jgi:hypothetical protein
MLVFLNSIARSQLLDIPCLNDMVLQFFVFAFSANIYFSSAKNTEIF